MSQWEGNIGASSTARQLTLVIVVIGVLVVPPVLRALELKFGEGLVSAIYCMVVGVGLVCAGTLSWEWFLNIWRTGNETEYRRTLQRVCVCLLGVLYVLLGLRDLGRW